MLSCYSLLRFLLSVYLLSSSGSLWAYRLIVYPMLKHSKLLMHGQ